MTKSYHEESKSATDNQLPFQPNTTQIPNVFFDYWMGVLTHTQFKVLMAIARKTFGWHKRSDAISRKQIEGLTGCSRDSVRKAIAVLEEHNLLNKIMQKSKFGDNDPNIYEINVIEAPKITDGGLQKAQGVGEQKSQGGLLKSPTKETKQKQLRQKKSYSPSSKKSSVENRVISQASNDEVSKILAKASFEQKDIYWKLLKLIPHHPDDKMIPPKLCANIAVNNEPRAVEVAILIYEQDKVRYERRGAYIEKLAGYIISSINQQRVPMTEEAEENRKYFFQWAKGKHQHHFELVDKYIVFKMLAGTEVPLNMQDTENFKRQLDRKYESSLEQRTYEDE